LIEVHTTAAVHIKPPRSVSIRQQSQNPHHSVSPDRDRFVIGSIRPDSRRYPAPGLNPKKYRDTVSRQPADKTTLPRKAFTRFCIKGALLLVLVLPVPGTAFSSPEKLKPRPEILVSGSWLSKNLKNPSIRIIDLRPPVNYANGHVPGAQWLSPGMLFTSSNGVDGMLPEPADLKKTLEAVGIDSGLHIICYDSMGGEMAARLFWALEYLGHDKVSLLDGGWPKWLSEKRRITRREKKAPPGTLNVNPNPDVLAVYDWLLEKMKEDRLAIIDARPREEYRGKNRRSGSSGHIPGAINLYWSSHLNRDGTLRSPEELLAMLEKLGVTPEKETVVYSQVMKGASHTYFTLRWLGFPRVRGYDGSWSEWSARPESFLEQ